MIWLLLLIGLLFISFIHLIIPIFVASRKTQRYCCDKCRRKGE